MAERSIYQPGESVLHRLNPVTTFVLAACLSVVVFVVPDYRLPLGLSIVLLALVFVARVHRLVLRLVAALAIPFAFFLLLIHGVLNPGPQAEPLVTIGPVTVWEAGFETARLIFLRILVLILSFLLFATTSQPQRMRVALMEKGVPNKLAYVFIASLQIIPEMRTRAKSIADAQQARGLDIHADIRTRTGSIVALMAPLLIGTLIAANTRALALDARGFDASGERTFLYDVPDTGGERLLRYAAVVAVFGALAWRLLP
ncbi:energy-coupling factor transporter transmembrane component T family protein [Halomarina pelagica]|uniref:energy-coupling factor transporter transmembrane component T family protein n=1 Tax=Halomarina pelagica TaxID=2961599 RepID=UPI0020C4D7DC|nr:energy-coupling factor transporter transmembrane component T [Halomarina sp. BND7]